jgi:hypothetical protein
MKKTNIILKGYSKCVQNRTELPKLRVKIDSIGFPYVIVDNEKILICQTDFPLRINVWGNDLGEIDIVSGLDELKAILANPELTTDKLPLKQLVRTAA